MSMEYSNGYCNNCEASVKIEKAKTNHILHLLMTIVLGLFTFGIGALVWIGIWFLVAVFNNRYNCTVCGTKNINSSMLSAKIRPYHYVLVFLLTPVLYVLFLMLSK